MKMEKKNGLKGYTLGEMATVVAIIGTLTAVAAPNYLRIKMEINMEMVQHELRMIQKNMKDLYTKRDPNTGAHAYPQDINNLPGANDEEEAITASLTAIDQREYTTESKDYKVPPPSVTYEFTTCPTRPGVSGDKCFILDQLSIRIEPLPALGGPPAWDGSGANMPTNMPMSLANQLSDIGRHLSATHPFLTQAQKAELFANWLETQAFTQHRFLQSRYTSAAAKAPGAFPSALVTQSTTSTENMENLMPFVYDQLKAKGIQVYTLAMTKEEAILREPWNAATINQIYNTILVTNPNSSAYVKENNLTIGSYAIGFQLAPTIDPTTYESCQGAATTAYYDLYNLSVKNASAAGACTAGPFKYPCV